MSLYIYIMLYIYIYIYNIMYVCLPHGPARVRPHGLLGRRVGRPGRLRPLPGIAIAIIIMYSMSISSIIITISINIIVLIGLLMLEY